jgi:predicted DNA-binding transcriptional regulator AlpA
MREHRSREATHDKATNLGPSPSHFDDATLLAHLSPLALVHWPAVARQVCAAGVLKSADVMSLVRYCEAFAQWCATGEELATMLIELGLASRQAAQVSSSISQSSPANAQLESESTKRPVGRAPNAILRRADVEVETGLSRSTIYQRIKVGTFPAPVKLGMRSVGWRVADIETFLSSPADYKAVMATDACLRETWCHAR